MIKSNQPICISQRSNDRLNINKKKFKISKANRILLKISILSWINRQISQETFPLSLFIAMPNGNRRSKSFFSRDKSGRPLSQINATWIFAVSVNRFLFSYFFFPPMLEKKKKRFIPSSLSSFIEEQWNSTSLPGGVLIATQILSHRDTVHD